MECYEHDWRELGDYFICKKCGKNVKKSGVTMPYYPYPSVPQIPYVVPPSPSRPQVPYPNVSPPIFVSGDPIKFPMSSK